MSISTTENPDSVRALDAAASYDDRVQAAERAMVEEFKKACKRCDANSYAGFAPLVTDWGLAKTPHPVGAPAPKRAQVLSEVMVDSLDYRSGPSVTEVMQLILNAANGMDVQAQAQGLIDSMAANWASFNTEVE